MNDRRKHYFIDMNVSHLLFLSMKIIVSPPNYEKIHRKLQDFEMLIFNLQIKSFG